MSDPTAPTSFKDVLITFSTIYALLTALGNLSKHLWMWKPAPAVSLALFAALVALYAIGTGPGRRMGWRVYLLCGALVPGAVILLAIAGARVPFSDGRFDAYEALSSGLEVGFRGESPTGLLLWVLEIDLLIQIGPLLRHFVRKIGAGDPQPGSEISEIWRP